VGCLKLLVRHRSLTAGRAARHTPDALSSRDVHSSAGGISSWHKLAVIVALMSLDRRAGTSCATTTMFLHVAASLGMIDSNDNLPTDCQPTTFNLIQPIVYNGLLRCSVSRDQKAATWQANHVLYTSLETCAVACAIFSAALHGVCSGHLFYSDRFGIMACRLHVGRRRWLQLMCTES
jgi:hypothetical protein